VDETASRYGASFRLFSKREENSVFITAQL